MLWKMYLTDTELFIMIYGIVFVKQVTISVRRVRASNGRQNRFLYRSRRNGQSRKNIVLMRLCGVSSILFSRRGEQIILLFFLLVSVRCFVKMDSSCIVKGFQCHNCKRYDEHTHKAEQLQAEIQTCKSYNRMNAQ